ncbi:ketopantoate reductase family protein [Salinicola avicenniae]|uniref:ketopantoate reductase family protein n=1 Tax=Salinicola avicenniae TaxID=2916836 RepID=UPI002072BA17|nr:MULTISPECIES: 2-dehydropantoate 2-reductase [unclassified Salinicola]
MKGERDRWLVIGAGALGMLFAARLARYHSVTLLGRATASTGSLSLMTPEQEPARADIERVTVDTWHPPQSPDVVVLATKAHDGESALQPLRSRLAADTPLLLLQNGFRLQPRLTDQWPGAVICASTTEAAYRPDPPTATTEVVHAARGHTWIGDLHQRHAALAETLATALRAAGLAATACADIRLRLWHKLAINAVINPLTARDRVPNGALAAPDYHDEIGRLVDEIDQIMAFESIPAPSAGWTTLIDDVIHATAANHSSMLQDVLAGRATEREAILGPLLDAARDHCLLVPALTALYHATPR